jgi:uncharacterized protein YbbC (DUF1343 family)
MKFGIDNLISDPARFAPDARVAMITNDAARLAADAAVKSRVALQAASCKLVRLFSPEHGIDAKASDGERIADAVDALTGLPVVSLYGEKVRPVQRELSDIDAVIYDIPDIGARFYTYIWTLSHALEACAEANKPIIVLDRPNPIGGELDTCEGPMLEESRFSTFVGRWNMPIRYGLTIGELATVWNSERNIGADLRVIRCEGWKRGMHWPQTGLPFVPTSPAIQGYESALVYPGTALFEGTNLSEGRGADAPFRLIGAPWIDGERLSQEFNEIGLSGVRAEPVNFTPRQRKHAGHLCGGVRLMVTEPQVIRPVRAGLHLLAAAIAQDASRFAWDSPHFDRLVGIAGVRDVLSQRPSNLWELLEHCTQAGDWKARVTPHLLY